MKLCALSVDLDEIPCYHAIHGLPMPDDGADHTLRVRTRVEGGLGCTITHVYGLTEVYGPAAVAVKRPGWAGESQIGRAHV